MSISSWFNGNDKGKDLDRGLQLEIHTTPNATEVYKTDAAMTMMNQLISSDAFSGMSSDGGSNYMSMSLPGGGFISKGSYNFNSSQPKNIG